MPPSRSHFEPILLHLICEGRRPRGQVYPSGAVHAQSARGLLGAVRSQSCGDHAIGDSHDEVPAQREFEILRAIAFEIIACVELPTVELEDQAVTDQQVDATHTEYVDLGAHGHAESMHQQARDRLETRVALGRSQVERRRAHAGTSGCAMSSSDCIESWPRVECRLERDHRRNRARAAEHLRNARREAIANPPSLRASWMRRPVVHADTVRRRDRAASTSHPVTAAARPRGALGRAASGRRAARARAGERRMSRSATPPTRTARIDVVTEHPALHTSRVEPWSAPLLDGGSQLRRCEPSVSRCR